MDIFKLANPDAADGLDAIDGASPIDAALLRLHRPDETWLCGEPRLKARCSLWWREAPQGIAGRRVGVIGHYAASNAESGRQILEHAAQRLADERCTIAIGPMDGNTWHRYRLVTEQGPEPPFFLEPSNPRDWPEHFEAGGFTPLAQYFSAISETLDITNPKTERARERFAADGVTIRPIRIDQFEKELSRIHRVSLASFQHNFLYTPIGLDEFVSQYQAVRELIVPELVLIAERGDDPVGFMFALPDLMQKRRGQPIDTVIVKTVAVLPGRAQAGLGAVLVAMAHDAARALGLRRTIHALMHESNQSLNLSAHYCKPFRRYTLFARELNG